MGTKLKSGSMFPEFTLPMVGGSGIRIGGEHDRWQLVIVYRGRHCPLSKRYLGRLNDMIGAFAEHGIEILVVSADWHEQAEADVQEFGWRFAVGYDLTVEQMRSLGTFISEPQVLEQTDRPFSEPGLFAIRPDGTVHIIHISNSPFSLPDLDNLLAGLAFIRRRNYPLDGTME